MYRPSHIFYMNTIECNQRCTKCSHWKYKDQEARLPPQVIIDSISSIPTARELCIVGGEPLLFKKEVLEILEGISNSSIRTVLVTNGAPLDKKFVDAVVQYDIHIVVSIDTLDKEFWKFVRGTNSRDKVLKNFEYAHSVLSPAQISIQSVLSKETESHMAEVSAYAEERNVYHSVQDYISEGFEGSWTPLNNKIVEIPAGDQQCFAADRNLSILQNGDVLTCFQQTQITGGEKPLGNLKKQKMHEILSSGYANAVSEKMTKCDLPCKVLKCNTNN